MIAILQWQPPLRNYSIVVSLETKRVTLTLLGHAISYIYYIVTVLRKGTQI
jgi:hypothetical protein